MKAKSLICILTAALLLMLTAMPAAMAVSNYYYVYTQNGKPLNVRLSPSLNAYKVGSLPYGREVEVLYFQGEWACIEYHWQNGGLSGDECYVMKKFLSSSRPGSRSSGSSSTSRTPSSTGDMGVMNLEFNSLQLVNPFTISSRPLRTSGFVNLRWAPSEYAAIATICYYGHQLTVLASTNNWYQVKDPSTGYIGYIMKQFTTVN